jgi:hypothetical protein
VSSGAPPTLLRADPGTGGDRQPRLDDDPIIHDAEPGAFLFGSWKNVVVAIWESQATAPGVERMAKVIRAVAETRPGTRSNIHIIMDGAALPEAHTRAKFVELMKQNDGQVACIAVVAGGTGFWASAFRSFITGLRWLAPRSYDLRLHGTLEEVVRWLPPEHLRRTGVKLDPVRLQRLLAEWTDPKNHGTR